MRMVPTLGALAVLAATAVPAAAGDIAWLPSLDKGLEAARQSGRAVLYVTLWKPGT